MVIILFWLWILGLLCAIAAIVSDGREEKEAKAKGCPCTWGVLLRRNHVDCEIHGQGLRDFYARQNQ